MSGTRNSHMRFDGGTVARSRSGGFLAGAAMLRALASGVPAQDAIADSAPSGEQPHALFNGTDLAGWWGCGTEDPRVWRALPPAELAARKEASRADIRAHWRVEEGELVNDGEGPYLTTNADFGDFELFLEYRTVAGADSGIYLRGLPQVQIWDTTEAGGKWELGADMGSGGLWNNSAGAPGKDPLVHADRPLGEWNAFRIVMVGERVTAWLNEKLVVDHARLENYFDRSPPVPHTDPIQLQTHGGEIRWRRIELVPIPPARANEILRRGGFRADGSLKPADARFAALDNGRDSAGWEGDLAGYEVRDGAIACREGHGGTLTTAAEFGDFEVELEIRIPPGGNNGLAIRFAGEGDPAYAGMCELQVLDGGAEQWADLDPRQFHGAVYGQIAPHRGYLRPAGEWNFQRVLVQGTRIAVELNGTRILAGDVAAMTESLHEPERFAHRLAPRGRFGFAGHGDPVAFRGIRIRRLGG
ncbi:MAG: DUF1080 domain-containing protein [Planctomycetota bacterium]